MGVLARAISIAPAVAALTLGACNREARDLKPTPTAETGPHAVSVSDLYPGPVPSPTPDDPRAQEYEGNAFHIANGQRYFKWFNCVGCHFNGGGGIGPPLMDETWRYGGKMEQIYASISQGRPNGMPSFKDKIPEAQIWEIAAYVRSLSGEANKIAAPSRQDAIRSTPPINNADAKPQAGDAAAVKAGGG
ncbi:c-type cytochrome [Phenylobacterium soli]|uniref:Cytochrome C n=1 Tax=Phenylobacterium soli TaxID=2170551 RepID=A0A328AEP4_9CAUL|nr:c-type cytochrome [Phenylobacterium soli]RAK53101.1 cytochrome C [Phenylobacterium soli]